MKTYAQWILAGRHVQHGEKAVGYLYSPGHTHRLAVFAEEQTKELEPEQTGEWEYYPRDAAPPLAGKAPNGKAKPKVLVDYNSETRDITIWCGPNQDVINQLKEGGYEFRQRDRRWLNRRKNIDRVIRGIENDGRNLVVTTVDGKPYDPDTPPL